MLKEAKATDWLSVFIGAFGVLIAFTNQKNITAYFKDFGPLVFTSVVVVFAILIIYSAIRILQMILKPPNLIHSKIVAHKFQKTIHDNKEELLAILDRFEKALNDQDSTNTIFYVIRSLIHASGIQTFQKISYAGTDRFRDLIKQSKTLLALLPERREYFLEFSKILNNILHLCNRLCAIDPVRSINYSAIHGDDFPAGEYDRHFKMYRPNWMFYLRLLEDYEQFSIRVNKHLPEMLFEPTTFEKPSELESVESVKDQRQSIQDLTRRP